MFPKAAARRLPLMSFLLKWRGRATLRALQLVVALAVFALLTKLIESPKTQMLETNTSHLDIDFRPWALLSSGGDVPKCSLAFGNSFSKRFDICGTQHDAGTSPACFYNEPGKTTFCSIENLSLDRRKIKVSKGGEKIEEVLGRKEKEEMPRYTAGAFSIACPEHADSRQRTHPLGKQLDLFSSAQSVSIARNTAHLGDMLDALSTSPDSESNGCDMVFEEPTLFVTRWEYANLYHTMTDWFNVHQLLSTVGIPDGTFSIVLLDGHPEGMMDGAWPKLFGKVRRLSEISESTSQVCFRKAHFVAPGYNSPLYLSVLSGLHCESRNEYFTSFTDRILRSYQLLHLHDCTTQSLIDQPKCLHSNATLSDVGGNLPVVRIVFVFRMNYLIHPRQEQTQVSRTVQNEQELIDAALRIPSVSVHAVHFETMTMAEQLGAAARADILVGVHGAGLTHTLFQPSGSALIEILAQERSGNNHFKYLSELTQNQYYTHDPMLRESKNMYIRPEALREKLEEAVDAFRSTRKG